MRSNRKFLVALLAGALTAVPAFAMPVLGQTAGQDVKAAGRDTKDAAKDAGRGVKTGTKEAYHKTKSGTKHAYRSTKYHTRRAVHRTKNAAHGADEGAHQPQ